MRIRMTQHLSGTSESLDPGVVYDRPEAEARRLIDAGFAVPVAPEPVAPVPTVETATAPPPVHETAVARPKRRK